MSENFIVTSASRGEYENKRGSCIALPNVSGKIVKLSNNLKQYRVDKSE